MIKNIETQVKIWFPNTFNFKGLLVFGGIFLAIRGITIFTTKVNGLLEQLLQATGILLFAIFFLVLLLELLSNVFNNIFKNTFKIILGFFVGFLNIFRIVYINIVKFLIGGAIVSVIQDINNIKSNTITLKKGVGDDEYWNPPISFSGGITTVIFKISPSIKTHYWRMGLKFSQNNIFTEARHDVNYPLFHLTKDTSNDLKITYYNESKVQDKSIKYPIIDNYGCEPVFLKLNVKMLTIDVEILDSKKQIVFSYQLNKLTHKYAQIFAWGDGNYYDLELEKTVYVG